jgi:hypothetical protein
VAGTRIHGTTQRRPLEHFLEAERPHLLPAPPARYEVPIYARPKVHRDHHVEVARALYSVPGGHLGEHVEVRADSRLVRIFHRDAPRVEAKLRCVLGGPRKHGIGIVQRGREPMLGGPAVTHRDHHRAGATGNLDGPRVLGVKVHP